MKNVLMERDMLLSLAWNLVSCSKHSGIISLCYNHHTLWIAHPHATVISMNQSGIVAEKYIQGV